MVLRPERVLLPVIGLAGACLLLASPRAPAYVLTGDQLALDQRDLRLFDNFSYAGANANTTPDLSFPGYTGAALAIWKAAVEWGSELHIDGAGDPRQPGDLGSGGANFDFTWQGYATGVGSTNDNVISELSGSSGGILAFTELPTSDGWRIRFYGTWLWSDDPAGTSASNEIDIQGVACHELGHALGMGHSNVSGATMFASLPQVAADWRSIEADDQAGIQAIYGPRSPAKPRVADYQHLPGGLLRVEGTGFAASGNSVWFTHPGGDGTPLEVTGLASSGGTEILFALPAGAGAGDLLVRIPGTSGASLSNAFPFDPSAEPCFQPASYGTGKLSSAGSVASLSFSGRASLQFDDLRISLLGAPGGVPAAIFHGDAEQQVPFYGGWLLVRPPLVRAGSFTTDIFGYGGLAVPVVAPMVGTTRYYQAWFLDPGDPHGAGTSDALRVRFCP